MTTLLIQARTPLTVALATIALLSATPTRASPPSVQIETDVQERSYGVYGTDAEEIFGSIQRQRLGAEAGLAASGLTEAELSFSLSTSTNAASCRLSSVTLRATVTVTLPQHERPRSLDTQTRRQWDAYEALVEFHEYRHVEIEFQGVQELQAKLEQGSIEAAGASAEACNALVERAIEAQAAVTRRRHEAFHKTESAAVREAQSALRSEIEDVDARLRREKTELARLAAEIEAVEAEREGGARALEALTQRFGQVLPPPEFERAQELAAAIEFSTEDLNELVVTRNDLVAVYNARIEARAHLAERLSWTR